MMETLQIIGALLFIGAIVGILGFGLWFVGAWVWSLFTREWP
jgi:hypothetical protein